MKACFQIAECSLSSAKIHFYFGLSHILFIFLMKNQQTDSSRQCHRHSDKGWIVIAQSHCYRNTTEESAHGIAKVEGALNAASTQHFATFGVLHDEELLWRTDAEKTDAADEHQRY